MSEKVEGWNELQRSPQDLRSPMLYVDMKMEAFHQWSLKNVSICVLAYSTSRCG